MDNLELFKSQDDHVHQEVHEYNEHGHDHIMCHTCGATWTVVDTSTGPDFELLSEGDGFCEEQHGRKSLVELPDGDIDHDDEDRLAYESEKVVRIRPSDY